MSLLHIAARVAARLTPEMSEAWDDAKKDPPEGMSDMDWEEHIDSYFSNAPDEEISKEGFQEFVESVKTEGRP